TAGARSRGRGRRFRHTRHRPRARPLALQVGAAAVQPAARPGVTPHGPGRMRVARRQLLRPAPRRGSVALGRSGGDPARLCPRAVGSRLGHTGPAWSRPAGRVAPMVGQSSGRVALDTTFPPSNVTVAFLLTDL